VWGIGYRVWGVGCGVWGVGKGDGGFWGRNIELVLKKIQLKMNYFISFVVLVIAYDKSD
jgi:hypothetical protein